MNLNNKLLNNYWLVIGIISGIFYIFSKDITILIFPQLLMLFSHFYPGNIFFIKRSFDIKKFLLFLLIFLLIFYVENIIEFKSYVTGFNYAITTLFSVSAAVAILIKESIGISFALILTNLKIIKSSFFNYILKFNIGTFWAIVIEIILISYLMNIPIDIFGKSLIIIFWAVGAYFLILITYTPLIFEESTETILKMFKIYGIVRLTFYILPFYSFNTTLDWISFSYLFSMFYLTFMADLIPYIISSKELKDSIKIMKYLSKNENKKVNQIARELNSNDIDYVENLLKGLKHRYFLNSERYKKWSLSSYYKRRIH